MRASQLPRAASTASSSKGREPLSAETALTRFFANAPARGFPATIRIPRRSVASVADKVSSRLAPGAIGERSDLS
jgi:hypothetical protein